MPVIFRLIKRFTNTVRLLMFFKAYNILIKAFCVVKLLNGISLVPVSCL